MYCRICLRCWNQRISNTGKRHLAIHQKLIPWFAHKEKLLTRFIGNELCRTIDAECSPYVITETILSQNKSKYWSRKHGIQMDTSLGGKSATCVCFKLRFLQWRNVSFGAGVTMLNLDLLCWALRSIIGRSPDRHMGRNNQESTGGWQSTPSTNHEVPATSGESK